VNEWPEADALNDSADSDRTTFHGVERIGSATARCQQPGVGCTRGADQVVTYDERTALILSCGAVSDATRDLKRARFQKPCRGHVVSRETHAYAPSGQVSRQVGGTPRAVNCHGFTDWRE
jgi:hypothetical protein